MADIRKRVKKTSVKKQKTESIKMTSVKTSAPKNKVKSNHNVIKMTQPKNINTNNVKKSSQHNNNYAKIYGLKLLNNSQKLLRQKKFVSTLIVLFLVITIIVLAFSTPTGLPEYISNTIASISPGNGFPVQPEGGKILYSDASNSNVFSLTDTNFVGFNRNGKEILSIQHGYDNPSSFVSNSRCLIYNYKNNKYTVTNNNSKIFSYELDNEINLGTICNNGNYAFATNSVGYAGQVDVFNKKAKKIFSWFSATEPISNILLSDNGKRLAVATVSASNGYVKSTVYCLKFNSATPLFKYELNGPILELKSYSDGFIAILSNKIVYYNWNRGEKLAKDYNADKIYFAKTKESGDNIVVTQNGIITNSYSIHFSKKHKEKFNIEYNGVISDIDFHNNLIYILSNRRVSVINSKNEVVKTYDLDNIANAILITQNGSIFTYNDSGVFKIN